MVIWCYLGHEILLVYQWITKIWDPLNYHINHQLITQNLVGLPINYQLYNWSWNWSTYSRSRCPGFFMISNIGLEVALPKSTIQPIFSVGQDDGHKTNSPAQIVLKISWNKDSMFQLLVSVSISLFHSQLLVSYHIPTLWQGALGAGSATLPAHDCCLTELPEYPRSLAYWP